APDRLAGRGRAVARRPPGGRGGGQARGDPGRHPGPAQRAAPRQLGPAQPAGPAGARRAGRVAARPDRRAAPGRRPGGRPGPRARQPSQRRRRDHRRHHGLGRRRPAAAGTMTGMRTIALEEHFLAPGLTPPPGTGPLASWGPQIGDQLRDLGQERLASMDASGIDFQVISHVAPAAQGMAGPEGATGAREANDQLAAAVAARPDRFGGFATLPTADPAAAAAELERAVTELGLAGAMINSTLGSNGAFLDEPGFAPLLERFERLDAPLYLHPAPPSAALQEVLYRGLPPAVAGRLATGAWGWHAEAGLHVLRMIATGVFDRHPGLRMIVGHCGEMVPFMLDRIDAMLEPARLGPPG